MDIGVIILLSLVGIVVLYFIATYNRFVSLSNKAHNAFSNIDVMLKKRYDLIPNLVSAVKGYMKHEQETLEKLTALRSQAMQSDKSEEKKIDLNNKISQALGQVMVSMEAYPDLKASNNIMHLQRSLTEIEEQLSASRRSYNMTVTQYNNALQMFPSNIIGNMLSYENKTFFEATPTEKQVVDTGAFMTRDNQNV